MEASTCLTFLLSFVTLAKVCGQDELKVSSKLVAVPPYLKSIGNSSYEGYIVDLMDALTAKMNKTYKFVITDSTGKKTGSSWDGMVGAVHSGAADVAAGPLTETMEREEAVDFTYAFQRYEAMALLRVRDPRPKNLEELLEVDGLKYGMVADSPMKDSLEEEKGELQQRLWEGVQNSSMFLANNQLGLDKVLKDDDFVFLMESAAADAAISKQPCDLMEVPAGFYKRKFALAVKNQSRLRDAFNKVIAELTRDGTLQKLEEKWFESKDCGSAANRVKYQSPLPLVIVTLLVLICSW